MRDAADGSKRAITRDLMLGSVFLSDDGPRGFARDRPAEASELGRALSDQSEWMA
jgi:hypothetical protein